MLLECPNKENKKEEDVLYLFWKIKKQWRKNIHKTLDDFSMTGPQFDVLGTIKELSYLNQGKEIRQIDISNWLGMDPMTASTILRNLQKKGLIYRESSKVDTRAKNIVLTIEGEKMLRNASDKMKELQNKIFKNFDRNVLIGDLKTLLQGMKEINESKN